MSFSRISQVAHYVPDQVVTNDDLAAIMETSDEWIASRTGIRQRHISQTEDTSQLATRVAEQLLTQSGLTAEELDFIIIATITPDSLMPSTAARVQGAIGATRAFAFDLSAACSGFVFALATADKLIASGSYQRGLVIGAEVFSKTLDWSDRSTAVLFGDGAGGQALQSGQSAFGSPFAPLAEKADAGIQMNGRAVFDFAVRQVSASVQQLLDQQGLAATDLDALLFHQANKRILEKMAKKLAVPTSHLPMNLDRYGNTSAASLPILLSECLADGRLTLGSGQTILLSGFGGGLTWGNMLIKL